MAELVAHDPGSRHILRGPAAGVVLAGLTVPVQPCRAAEQNGRAVLWLGPDEWLLLGIDAPNADFPVIDISHRQLGYRLSGTDAATLLAGGVPLDLSESAFPVGMCARTLFDKAEIVLWRRGATEWRIEVARSFAPYFRDLLRAIAAANGISCTTAD